MSFDYAPVLKGELVEVRPLQPQDFDSLYAVASDPLIWEQHPVPNRYEKAAFREFFRESLETGGALVVTDLKSGRVIGSSRYHGYSEARSEIEIGWTFLARARWGGLYNGELKRLMLDHAFRFVDRVVFLIGLQNVRSQRAMEKVGGIRVGTSRDTGGHDSYVYQITSAGFETRQNTRRTSSG